MASSIFQFEIERGFAPGYRFTPLKYIISDALSNCQLHGLTKTKPFNLKTL
ncbi:hypothetical protein HMPREF0239_05030 [Clostridium sp. ATCC BAA-442]|nr:hypothetical protein HMPREF0239_05030 [Clostridium sp. ATCC BAA-442]